MLLCRQFSQWEQVLTMLFALQVAVGTLPKLTVFGDDYDTPDGTGMFVHHAVAPTSVPLGVLTSCNASRGP